MNRYDILIGKEPPLHRFRSMVTPKSYERINRLDQETEIVAMHKTIPWETFNLKDTRAQELIIYRTERELLNSLLMKLQPFIKMSSHNDMATHEKVITGEIEVIRPEPGKELGTADTADLNHSGYYVNKVPLETNGASFDDFESFTER